MMEALDCILCSEGFDYDKHVPRVLKCGHTFCTECLVKLIINEAYYKLNCPFTRQKIMRFYGKWSPKSTLVRNFVEAHVTVSKEIFILLGHKVSKITKRINDIQVNLTLKEKLQIQDVKFNKEFRTSSENEFILEHKLKSNKSNKTTRPNNQNFLSIYNKHNPSFDPGHYQLENIDNIIYNVQDNIEYNENIIKDLNAGIKIPQEQETLLQQCLDETGTNVIPATKLCKTIQDFQEESRWTKSDEDSQTTSMKTKPLPLPLPIEDYFNVSTFDKIIEDIVEMPQYKSTVYATFIDYVGTHWSGRVTAQDDQYYISAMAVARPPRGSTVTQLDHFLPLLHPSQTIIKLELNLNKQKTCSVTLRLNNGYSTYGRLLDQLLWQPEIIQISMSENTDNVILTIKTTNHHNDEILPLDCPNPLGVVCLNEHHQLEIVMTNNNTSNISQPIGTVVSGMCSLLETCKELAKDQSVALVNTSLVINNIPGR